MAPRQVISGELPGWRKIVPAVIPIVVGLLLFSSTGRDDSHITYWAAHALATTGEVVNYNGDRVEQSTSLTHVVLLAALKKMLPFALPTIGVLVSIAGGALTVILTQTLAASVLPDISLLAGLLTGFSGSLIYWSFGGLETTLAASLSVALLLMCVRWVRDRPSRSTILTMCSIMFLYLLVRPESIVVIGSVLLGGSLLLHCRIRLFDHEDAQTSRDTMRRMLGVLALAALVFAVIVAFRQSYFGASFPQPVAAKSAGLTRTALRDGATYLAQQIWSGFGIALWSLAVYAAALLVRKTLTAPHLPVAELLVALFMLAYTAFIVLSGGDWMEGGRFLVPMLPVVVIMALLGLRRMGQRKAVSMGMFLLVLQLAGTLSMARYESTGRPLWTTARPGPEPAVVVSWFDTANRLHYRYLRSVSYVDGLIRALIQRGTSPVTFMSCQMGTLPYYLSLTDFGRLRIIDTCALVSRDFTACPVSAWLPKNRFGLRLSLEFFFQNRQQLWNTCRIGEPDIIFETDRTVRLHDGSFESVIALVERNGYTVVYQQHDPIVNDSLVFPGTPIGGGEFIALRNNLVF
jgi:hypothetical protein